MAGRESEHDNSIELIASDHRTDPNTTNFMLTGPSVTSFVKNQTDAEHDKASLNALRVAFNSLQGYHNEQAKKLFSLQRKYTLLQEFVQNIHGNIDLGFLEQSYPQDHASMAQAAGAYNETQEYGTVLLQRELKRNFQTIALNKQEIIARDERINEYDQKLKAFMKERERLQGDVEALSIVLEQKKAEITAKDKSLRELNGKIEALQLELDAKNAVAKDNETLRQRIELYERSGILNDIDPEKDEIKTRLKKVQEECQRLHAAYEEQSRVLAAKDNEITRLQSQCKQFEIENSILRSQRNEGYDMMDSGTNAELEKALELVKKQSNEIKALKNTAQQQNSVIQQLITKARQSGLVKAGEVRDPYAAEGESDQYYFDELKFPPYLGQKIVVDPRPVRSEIPSTAPRYSNNPESNKAVRQRPLEISSPKITECVVPTGNIKPMLANENGRSAIPALNVVDCPIAPMQNVYIDTSNPKPTKFRASDSDLFRLAGHYDTSQRNNSSSLSPPGLLTRNRDQQAYVNHGVKPQAVDKLGFPSRMAQSEVIYGNLSKRKDVTEDTTKFESLAKSSFYPAANLNHKLENRPVCIPKQVRPVPQTIGLDDNEPDYENVFQTDETKEKQPGGARDIRTIYENLTDTNTTNSQNKDDRAFVVIPNKSDLGNFAYNKSASGYVEKEWNKVNSLKICPSCNREFSRLSTEEFQLHVYECFDSGDDQPNTLQATVNISQEEDRSCPMCGAIFPMSVPQETFEDHVQGHFGEEAPIERFEIINS